MNNNMITIPAKSIAGRWLGRTLYIENEETIYFDYPCSGVELFFTGTHISADFVTDEAHINSKGDHAIVSVYVDDSDIPYARFALDKLHGTYTIYSSEKSSAVKLRIIKTSEAQFGKAGIKCIHVSEGAELAPTEPKARSIEFIGDSISVGYGVTGKEEDEFTTVLEDGMLAHTSITARNFDADYYITASSGIGVFSSYTPDGARNAKMLMPRLYPYTDLWLQENIGDDNAARWDFSKGVDLIVINLGTNDNSYIEGDAGRLAEFGNAYYEFLKQVHELNPKTPIICTIWEEMSHIFDEIERQAERFILDLDFDDVYAFMLPMPTEQEGYGPQGHPNKLTQARMAKALTAEITEMLGWQPER